MTKQKLIVLDQLKNHGIDISNRTSRELKTSQELSYLLLNVLSYKVIAEIRMAEFANTQLKDIANGKYTNTLSVKNIRS